MTPTQREAARRLAPVLADIADSRPPSSVGFAVAETAALLRELLAAEPVQETMQKKPSTASQFESVKEAKKVAEAQLSYYRKMMADKSTAPVVNQQMTTEPVQEPAAWGVFVDDELFKPFNCKDEAVDWFQAQYNHGSRYDYLVLPLYTHLPQQRKPLTPSMQAEVECDCLVAWNASTYGHSAQDTVHPMFLSAFLSGYRAAERAHGIGEPT